jgi:hypothetical protein
MNRAERILTAVGTLGVYPLVQYERQQNAELRFVEQQQYLAQQQYLSQQYYGYPGQVPAQFYPGPGGPQGYYSPEAAGNSAIPPNNYGTLNDTAYSPVSRGQYDGQVNVNYNPGRPQYNPGRPQQNQVGRNQYEIQQQPSPYLPAVSLSDTPADLAQEATAGMLNGWNRNGRYDLTMARDILLAARDADEQNKRYHDYYHMGQKTDYYKEVKKALSRDVKEATGGALSFKEVNQYGYPTVYAVEDTHRNFYT